MTVPALTLWQPWASLVAEGVKTIETRSWPAPAALAGERIAIHAGAKRPLSCHRCNGAGMVDGGYGTVSQCPECAGSGYMPVGVMEVQGAAGRYWMSSVDAMASGIANVLLPLGAVVATARLAACIPMLARIPAQADWIDPWDVLTLEPWPIRSVWPGFGSARTVQEYSAQLPYGDFAPGRWAWMLADVERLDEPIPAKGRQRLWQWNPGDDR